MPGEVICPTSILVRDIVRCILGTGVFTPAFLLLAEMLNIWPNCMLLSVINGDLSVKMVFYRNGP